MKTISFQSDILPLKNELFRMALRITQNREEAEDVVQETMMKVWNRRDQWSQLDSIEAFCLTICRNQALDKPTWSLHNCISRPLCGSVNVAFQV